MTAILLQQTSGDTARIALTGRFDFASHRDFRKTYEDALELTGVQQIEIDLAAVEYIDSSALGMLLLLREKALSHNLPVTLLNAQGPVQQVLEIANFGKLFQIG